MVLALRACNSKRGSNGGGCSLIGLSHLLLSGGAAVEWCAVACNRTRGHSNGQMQMMLRLLLLNESQDWTLDFTLNRWPRFSRRRTLSAIKTPRLLYESGVFWRVCVCVCFSDDAFYYGKFFYALVTPQIHEHLSLLTASLTTITVPTQTPLFVNLSVTIVWERERERHGTDRIEGGISLFFFWLQRCSAKKGKN